ncbi:MAG: ATP synthase F1 subunit gamma [Parabacteroides sp.]
MSLKEIKNRIASITSTQKITSAMKMISSAKLHHAQGQTVHLLPYARTMNRMLQHLLALQETSRSLWSESRPLRRVTWVVFSSNNGLCGTFNANVLKELQSRLSDYRRQQIEVTLFPVGKKVEEALQKEGLACASSRQALIDKPDYAGAAALADELAERFRTGQTDRVELLYHHFKSTASQLLQWQTYLPISPEPVTSSEAAQPCISDNWIIEPDADTLQQILLPKVLRLTLYSVLLDTTTAEQAARVMAMQTATDNANDLIQSLTLQYNKSRQQAITNELMDIRAF